MSGSAGMKVRWLEGSIRLRITPTELAELVLGHPVGATIALPGGASWSVRVVPGAADCELVWRDGDLCVTLTSADISTLAEGDVEGVYHTTGGERPIRYFVEKDFPCAHPHPVEAAEPETERFAPTPSYLRRKRMAAVREP